MKKDVCLILDDIRSAHNVGSIFRTADAAGVGKLYLAGYTPAPVDGFGRPNKEIAKTALGAEGSVPWEKVADAKRLAKKLKEKGYTVFALEQAEGSVDYRKAEPRFPLALWVGNEVGGIKKTALKAADMVVEIPMRGTKESLNVSVATGIALFELLKD